MNLSLTACSFLLKKRNSRGNYLFFNDKVISENSKEYSISEAFINFFKNHSEAIDDKDKKRTFHCEFEDSNCGETKDYSYVYCIIKSGVYGSSSEIINNKDRKIVHKKTADQTEEKPFYLYVIIPKDSQDGTVKVQKGMLFFQNVGQFGVKTVTTKYIREYFSENYNTTFVCKTIATKLFVDRMIKKEKVNQIIMTKNHKSVDSSDNFAKGYGCETKIISNLTLTEDKWKKLKNNMNLFSKSKFELFEFEKIEYNQLKVNVKIGNHYRTVNMGNLENLSLIEEIPDYIKMSDGHPDKEKLLSHFETVADDYLKQMVLQVDKN